MTQEPDYYAILQVDPRAEQEVIQAAYRRLAAKYHPDVDPSPKSTEKMMVLNAAYEVLSNPGKRRAYDLRRANRQGQQHPARGTSQWQRHAWRLLPLAVVIVAISLRPSLKLILVLGPVLFILWIMWGRRPSKPA